jgi:hypothetical protein
MFILSIQQVVCLYYKRARVLFIYIIDSLSDYYYPRNALRCNNTRDDAKVEAEEEEKKQRLHGLFFFISKWMYMNYIYKKKERL